MIYLFDWVQHSNVKNKPLQHTTAQMNLTDITMDKKKPSIKSIDWVVPFI